MGWLRQRLKTRIVGWSFIVKMVGDEFIVGFYGIHVHMWVIVVVVVVVILIFIFRSCWVTGELGQETLAGIECFNNDGNGKVAPVVFDDRLR